MQQAGQSTNHTYFDPSNTFVMDSNPAVRNAWELSRERYQSFRESDSISRIGARISPGDRDVRELGRDPEGV